MTALTPLRIGKRSRRARTLAGALLTVGLVVGGGVASASAATASPATHAAPAVTTGFCHDPVLGGTFYCDTSSGYASGEARWQFPNHTWQLFVIGTNGAVWTRWTNTSGDWSSWTSMGGVAIGWPPLFYSGGSFHQSGGGSYTPDLTVLGADNGVWHRQRSASGNWSPWQAGY